MKELQQKELLKIIKFVDAIGCKYKIITDDGQEFGTLNVTEKKELKRNLKRPYGELSNYYKPKLNLGIAVGEVQEISSGDIPTEDLRSAICSHLGKEWGKGSYATCIKNGKVEILRTA